jgi:hypothetical protein
VFLKCRGLGHKKFPCEDPECQAEFARVARERSEVKAKYSLALGESGGVKGEGGVKKKVQGTEEGEVETEKGAKKEEDIKVKKEEKWLGSWACPTLNTMLWLGDNNLNVVQVRLEFKATPPAEVVSMTEFHINSS